MTNNEKRAGYETDEDRALYEECISAIMSLTEDEKEELLRIWKATHK